MLEACFPTKIVSRQGQVDRDRLDSVQSILERQSGDNDILDLTAAELLRRVEAKPAKTLPEAEQIVFKSMISKTIVETTSARLTNVDQLVVGGVESVDCCLFGKVDLAVTSLLPADQLTRRPVDVLAVPQLPCALDELACHLWILLG